jgi:hypothetical protein
LSAFEKSALDALKGVIGHGIDGEVLDRRPSTMTEFCESVSIKEKPTDT